MTSALVPIADGFEEIEALTIVDVLRRAGVAVTVASLSGGPVRGRSAVTVTPDAGLDEALRRGPVDLIVLPGGMSNAAHLRDDPRVVNAVRLAHADGRVVAAICAAPMVLEKAGLLHGVDATIYPGMESEIPSSRIVEKDVVEAGSIITGRGPAAAMAFALTLVRVLCGPETSRQVAKALLAAGR
mgnify:CR=1 FL=1